jgi:hypothetical protein
MREGHLGDCSFKTLLVSEHNKKAIKNFMEKKYKPMVERCYQGSNLGFGKVDSLASKSRVITTTL